MMNKRIGINGFGRIGRLTLRRLMETNSNLDVIAINDLSSPKLLAHLFEHDTSYGKFNGTVSYTDKSIIINDSVIQVYSEKNAENIPWGKHKIDIVVECTGLYASEKESRKHISAGAKKVLVSAPAGDMKTVVYNVNDGILNSSDQIISAGSCTTNGLALMADPINQAFKIKGGTMTTIHALTASQSLVDSPNGSDLRASRASVSSIIPHSTGAAKAIGLVIPELEGKLNGHAQRVPVLTGSVAELVCVLEEKVTKEEIHQVIKEVAKNNESFDYTDAELVSSDIVGSPFGAIFDTTQTEIIEMDDSQLVKIVSWYDNEYGFVAQLVRTLEKYSSL